MSNLLAVREAVNADTPTCSLDFAVVEQPSSSDRAYWAGFSLGYDDPQLYTTQFDNEPHTALELAHLKLGLVDGQSVAWHDYADAMARLDAMQGQREYDDEMFDAFTGHDACEVFA